MKYMKQNPYRGTCTPTAIFNALRHYKHKIGWKTFKYIERKCKTGRFEDFSKKTGYCFGTEYRNELYTITKFKDKFKIIERGGICGNFYEKSFLLTVKYHLLASSKNSAIIHATFKNPDSLIAMRPKFNKMEARKPPSIYWHSLFIPFSSSTHFYCTNMWGTHRRVNHDLIYINAYFLLSSK